MRQNDEDFRQWLSTERSLTARSVNDVCSRLKRLGQFADITKMRTPQQLEAALIQAPAFQGLTMSVRSQVKHAGKLRLEYLAGRRS
jgi:hypothetical protein